MEMPEELEKLKEVIITYLFECPRHQAKKSTFWNDIAKYQNRNVAAKTYGISKMEKVFVMFNDVLIVTEKTVRLREGVASKIQRARSHRLRSASSHSNETRDSINITDSDDDSQDSTSQAKHRFQQSRNDTSHNASQESLMSWGSGVLDTSFESRRQSSAIEPPQQSSNLTGFIPLSSDADTRPGARNQSKASQSHVRYGNSSAGTPVALPPSLRNRGAPSQPGPSFHQQNQSAPEPQQSLYRPQPGGAGPQQALFRPQPSQIGSLPNLYRPQADAAGFQQNLSQPPPWYEMAAAQSGMNTMQIPGNNVSSQLTLAPPPPPSQHLLGQMSRGPSTAVASPALLTPPSGADAKLTVTEWPKPRARTGPPPGTKITDPPKEIKVKSITLQKGARLSAEQVNHEINDCIEILSSVNAHVSIERVEQMLLQKFQVYDFRHLNLHQRYFNQMETANEHSRLLCKVNAYIQNFARSRSMCTLYELGECCRDFHKHSEEFEKLRLGPLQKMPVVCDLFKFPMDEYIPEITSVDLLEHLRNFLDRNNKWTAQVQLEDFMKYLEEEFGVQSFSLGIRLRSLPLAIGTLKKSIRDAAQTRKRVVEEMMTLLQTDIKEAFSRYRESLLQTSDGSETHQLRLHYSRLTPSNAVSEILQKYVILANVMASDFTSSKTRKIERFMRSFESFARHLFEDSFPQLLFHLAVSMSDVDVQQTSMDFMEQQKQQSQQKAQNEATKVDRQPPSKHALTDKILTYVNKCLEMGALQLSHLKSIEEKVVDDFRFTSFHQFGHSYFLDFLLSDKKIRQALEECGGTLLGSSSAPHEGSGTVIASQKDLVEFVCQSRDAGIIQTEQLVQAICEQYHVAEVKALGHGNINRLCQAADRSMKNVAKHANCIFEAAVCGKSCRTTRSSGNVGLQGSQSREAVIACLTACPLLEDMSEWSHWPLLFQPQHGSLRDFISKHGGVQFHNIDGGKCTATSDFAALETEPGIFLKLSAQSTSEDFVSALEVENPLLAAGHLVSLIVSNKGIESTSLALLTTHVRAKLTSLHARMPTPGGPPHLGSADIVDPAVQFITTMLLRLPLRICIAVANQVLLEPLSKVVGSVKSKMCIAQACRSPSQFLQLEQLGCLLGVQEWMTSMASRMAFPAHLIQDNTEDDLLDQPQQEEDSEEEESSVEDDGSSEEDEELEIEHILSEPVDSGKEGGKSMDKEQDESLGTSSHQGDEQKPEEEESDSSSESDSSESSDRESGEISEDVEDDAEPGSTDKEQAGEDKGERSMSLVENDEPKEKEGDVAEEIERELTKEEKCQQIVNLIREKEFGVGIELTEEIRDLMLKQQERQGRSLERLSKELYSKDTHFVLELIQNADDNHYNDNITPAIRFVINAQGVTVMNNEQGFEENNIRALCDVGKSTKSKHSSGYIGQKGIGFKSVFRVTGRPEVHSNGYHIFFDVNSGPMGYILPHWSDTWEPNPSWQTEITLPWTKEIVTQITTHAARFNDVQPSLLLFLHRLKQITIDNQVENNELHMQREDLENGQVQISHTHGKDRWLVVRKRLDASCISIQAKSGVEVESTEIALAFPINKKDGMRNAGAKLGYLPVFAFLPLRSYGFRFIVQGDFDVPSSREDVDRDSSWNQWLRSEIPSLFLDAWDSFQTLPDLSPIEALMTYLQFVPMDGEVIDFFKPVSHLILSQLRAIEFLPVLGTSGDIQWKMPSKTIISRDTLVREIISPELLRHHLALYFLHDHVASVMDSAQIQALGVEKITTEHLLLIGQSVTNNWNGEGNADQIVDIAKWMACVYRSLDDFQDNSGLMQKLRNLKIIPLSSGRLVSVEDTTVFLLKEDQQRTAPAQSRKKGTPIARDPFQELKSDLNLVHTALTATPDMEINSQVVKLLMKMEVKQVTPHDLIHEHIMPILESDQWKKKDDNTLVSYLVYIKSEMDKSPRILEFERLRPVAPVLTNNGLKVPAQENVHFSREFKRPIDLKQIFPAMKWTLVASSYLPPNASPLDIQTWHKFLSTLGVNDFLCVRKEEVQLEQDKLHSSPWSAYKDLWPPSADGYVLHDFTCEEFYQLATLSNPSLGVMQSLYLWLDKMWDSVYRDFRFTQLKSGSGDVLKDTVETSFFIHLKTLPWVPACWMSVDIDSDNEHPIPRPQTGCRPPHHLYTQHPDIKNLLGDTVEYLNLEVPDSKSLFTLSIQVKHEVRKEAVKDALISWGQREATKTKTPKVFTTNRQHILNVYDYLSNELSQKESQDLFHEHPVFFIPLSHAQLQETVVGHMMKREEVCWQDDTGLFTKCQKSLELYQSPLATVKFIRPFYQHYEQIFQQARLKRIPDVLDCSELLKHVAAVYSLQDAGTLRDALALMSRIGSDLSRKDSVEAGVATNEAILAQANVEKVKTLLSPCAVFPTKGGKWVSLTDQPMISDSVEMEQMFVNKQGVHFLERELPAPQQRQSGAGIRRLRNKHNEDVGLEINPESVKLYLSLFEGIKPLSDCINSEVITSGFKPCFQGQMYMHKVIPLLQQFLYFLFPDVYDLVKLHEASTFKELQFIQVYKLEVKYELTDRPDVYEIKEDKCFVDDKMFYFHEKYIDEQAEIHREVAKFLSHGDKECYRELRSFLSQAIIILEGKSTESMQDLLSRQSQLVSELPEEEDVWEIPLPIAPEPQPKPVPDAMDVVPQEEMVYGRALSVPGSEASATQDSIDGGDSSAIRSWPPRSHVDVPAASKGKVDKTSAKWPPPEAPDYVKASRQLPSNIQFESEAQTESTDEPRRPRVVNAGGDSSPQVATVKETDANKKERQDKGTKSYLSRQSSQSGGGHPREGDLRQHVVTVPEKDGRSTQAETGEKRKRKWRDGSESEQQENIKRFNSVEGASSQVSETMDSAEEPAVFRDSGESSKESVPKNGNDIEEGSHMENVPTTADVPPQGAEVDEDHHSSQRKHKYLRFSIPLWSNQMEDLKYTEVASGSDLIINQKPLPENSQLKDIGQWGEALVYSYLLKQREVNPSILDIIWANENNETGLPYDIEIVFKTESDDTHYSVFVDVKATVTEDKAVFEISPKQIEFAMLHKERYQIFRVYNAGKDNLRLVRIDNIADRLVTKSVKLYMMI